MIKDKDICLGFTAQGECVREIPQKRMLAIFARPDYESFGAGRILAKYAQQGVQVVLLCVTYGESGNPGVAHEQAGNIRTRDLKMSAERLGIEFYFLDYPGGELPHKNAQSLLEMIATWIDLVQPQVIVTSGSEGGSGHQDQTSVSKLVTQIYDRCYKKGILLYIQRYGLYSIARKVNHPDINTDWFEQEIEVVKNG